MWNLRLGAGKVRPTGRKPTMVNRTGVPSRSFSDVNVSVMFSDAEGTLGLLPKRDIMAVHDVPGREIVIMANERLELIDEKIRALNLMGTELISLVTALSEKPPVACPLPASSENYPGNRIRPGLRTANPWSAPLRLRPLECL